MQLHELEPKTKQLSKRRIGRGGKRGKTSGRGTKGQKARAGKKIRPEIRDMIKKLPKRRGRGKNSLKSIQVKPSVVNMRDIDAVFSSGDIVSLKSLVAKGLVVKHQGEKNPRVKILGTGTLKKKVIISSECAVSKAAKEHITKAGGSIKE